MLVSPVNRVFLSLCLTTCASYSVYTATIAGNGGIQANASGEVTVFVSDPSSDGMYTIFAVGSVSGMEANLSESDCSASVLSCGMHLHDSTNAFLATDPSVWYPNKYTTTSAGEIAINFIIDTDRGDVEGSFLALHNFDGSWDGPGGLLVNQTSDVWPVTTTEIGSSGVDGTAILYTSSTTVMGAGMASGLSANVTDCSNGCGAHVHSGTSCSSTADQGGQYYNTAENPWTSTGYTSTDSEGDARFVFSVENDGVDIDGRTFIIHLQDGTRASCGLISSTAAPTAAPTPAPNMTMSPTMSPTMAPNMTMSPTMAPNMTMSPTIAPTSADSPATSGGTLTSVWGCSLAAVAIHFMLGC